jgi:hypothetical protein
MRITRGLLLKGNRLPEILPELWPIALFNRGLVLPRDARLNAKGLSCTKAG